MPCLKPPRFQTETNMAVFHGYILFHCLLSFIVLVVYQSVIIVPPSASVEISGAMDKIFNEARHKKPFTLMFVPSVSFGFKRSDNDTPFFESLEKIPGVLSSFVIGFVTDELLLEHAFKKIKIYKQKIYLDIK